MGYENGTIALYDTYTGSLIKSIFGINQSEIIVFKFFKEVYFIKKHV